MSYYIPSEVITNILEQLNVKDLVRCRRVSKLWKAIIDDTRFISSQLQRSLSANSNAALLLQNDKGPLLYLEVEHGSNISLSSSPFQYEANELLLMGSCHGLICFNLVSPLYDRIVLNPSTGERYSFPSYMSDAEEEEEDDDVPYLAAVGFGYDELTDDYRVVMMKQLDLDTHAEVYGVRDRGIMRTIHLPGVIWRTGCKRIGAFVSGALHWCPLDFQEAKYVILALDLGSLTFRRLPHPNYKFGHEHDEEWVVINIGVVDSCLCVCERRKNGDEIGIWVMKEYAKVESWTMIYCVKDSVAPNSVIPVGSHGGRILMMFDVRRLVWCDPWDGYQDIPMGGMDLGDGFHKAVYCLESLVKLFPEDWEIDPEFADKYKNIR
ncbi:F-box protein CPR1 [Linum perenne]